MSYLDNAATSFPKPDCVNDLLRSIAEHGVVSPGRGSHTLANKASDAVNNVRHRLANFFGAPGNNWVSFCFNATDALNLAIKGVLVSGDHVIISAMEHNSVLRPLRGLERSGVITLDIAPCDSIGRLDPDEVTKRFKKNTRLVVCSHASNVTGTIQPVAAIGKAVREHDAYFLVDAAQTAGVIPINIEEFCIDLLAFTGHKGLYGLQGTGGIAIGSRIKHLRPFREGGTGINSVSEVQPHEWPEAFEAGTPNVPGIMSLGKGLEFIEEQGMDSIHKRGSEQIEYLWRELSQIDGIELYGPEPSSDRLAVLSLNIRGWEPDDVGSILNHNHNIYVRTGLHCSPLAHQTINTYSDGTVRLSPGYFTTENELINVVKVIKSIAKTLIPY